MVLSGCGVQYRYAAVPVGLIPLKVALPTIKAEELSCLSDDVYLRLAERDRQLRYENAQMRALLMPE